MEYESFSPTTYTVTNGYESNTYTSSILPNDIATHKDQHHVLPVQVAFRATKESVHLILIGINDFNRSNILYKRIPHSALRVVISALMVIEQKPFFTKGDFRSMHWGRKGSCQTMMFVLLIQML